MAAFEEGRLVLRLTEEETRRYLDWCWRTAAEDDPFPAVALCFLLSNIGERIIACRGFEEPESGPKIVLRNWLDADS